jgi:hypothetical protein
VIRAANISSGWTWMTVQEKMKTQSISAFDLVICRGAGGVNDWLGVNANRHFAIFEKALTLLNPDDGILLTQVPVKDEAFLELLKNRMKRRGYNMVYHVPVRPENPDEVDAISQLPTIRIDRKSPNPAVK